MDGVGLGVAGWIHLTGALWVIAAGGVQLARPKGTPAHRLLGWSWMLALAVTAISSFWLRGFMDLVYGFSPIHALSLWVLFCILAAVYFVRRGNIVWHRAYVVGAYLGSIAAGVGALLGPNRFLYQWLFGP